MSDERRYRIGEVAKELEVEPHVVRYWEQEFGVRPLRSKSGQRVYTAANLARLREVHRLVKVEGLTHAGARKRLKAKQEPALDLDAMVEQAVARALERLFKGRPTELVTHRSRELLGNVVSVAVVEVLESLMEEA